MVQPTKIQIAANEFRARVAAILADTEDWHGYEPQLLWLRKLVSPDHGDVYTPAEHAGVARIAFVRKLFDGWDGYSVIELMAEGRLCVASADYEDELLLKQLESRNVSALRRQEMRWLVGLCRAGGLDILRFDPEGEVYDLVA